MAPKAKANAKPDKKKTVEDKTFGMKNKNKSKAVQNYVKQLENSMAPSQKQIRAQQMDPHAAGAKGKKQKEEEKKQMLNDLFSVTIKQPKLAAGVDPKSVVCEFFRHGQCTKGFKCKYSHDLNVEKKGPKIDLFTDQRDVKKDDEEGMEDWDQETLERVVKEKHGNEKPSNATSIICKHFLDAVEKKQYGWFWKCPGGNECKYRHALPPGYVLKSQMKELLAEEAANRKDVAEVIEEERAQVDAKTPINDDVFKAWHSKRMAEKRRKREQTAEERRRKGLLTGREIFMQEGFTAQDDAGAADAEEPRQDRAEEERLIQEMLDKAAADARAAKAAQIAQKAAEEDADGADGSGGDEAGPSTSSAAAAAATPAAASAAPATTLKMDDAEAQELFDDDDDEDLDEADLEELEAGIKSAKMDSS